MKSTDIQRDLGLTYSPGVAAPYHDIAEDENTAYEHTAKGNLVSVVSNGSAALGLDNIGAQVSKPVIEGKGVLFKRFADIDVFDVEFDHDDPQASVESVAAMEPTFDGINLKDIRTPGCFGIEESLRERMDIPVFHDDQHGTAIISGAMPLNAVDIAGKELSSLDITFSGADTAATVTTRFYVSLGIPHENITLCDIDGVLSKSRAEASRLDEYVEPFARGVGGDDLEDAMGGMDVLVGLSVGGIVSRETVRSIADDPAIFAMANPEPEIAYKDAKKARDDTVIMATGRSDYPNQVDNVLGFPFIFRGALDVCTIEINEEMKRAAAEALANLAQQDMPDAVVKAYDDGPLQFGPDCLIPRPLDQHILYEVTSTVTEAAMKSGATRRKRDLDDYRKELGTRLGKSREMVRVVLDKAASNPERIVLAKGEDKEMVRAASQLVGGGIAEPILVGRAEEILRTAEDLGLDFDPTIADPESGEWNHYVGHLYKRHRHKGLTRTEAARPVRDDSSYFASVVVGVGDADAILTSLTHHYPSALCPPLQIISMADDADYAAGVYMLTFRDRVILCADATVSLDPDENMLAEVTKHTAELVRRLNVKPHVALLSYSDFGSITNEETHKPRNTIEQLHTDPGAGFPVDGGMQTDVALVEEMLTDTYNFAEFGDPANVLTFPNLEAGNISYKLLQRLGDAEAIGPMLVDIDKPVRVLQHGGEVKDMVDLTGVVVVDAQSE